MEQPPQLPVSTVEAEQFWTGGEDARQDTTGLKDSEQPESSSTTSSIEYGLCRDCRQPVKRGPAGLWAHINGVLVDHDAVVIQMNAEQEGIDMPGVGVVRPGISPEVCAEGERAGDGVPQNEARDLVDGVEEESAAERRERLFTELVFAAKNLADTIIEPPDATGERAFCTECCEDEVEGVIAHDATCTTGRVFRVLAALVGTLQKSEPEEAATDGETPEAGDGIRPRGQIGLNELVKDLGELVEKAAPKSALRGLSSIACAFGCLLDLYAAPNPQNPDGMCADKAGFRKFFADLVAEGGAR